MAKRKRTTTLNTPKKRARGTRQTLQTHLHGNIDPSREYKVRSIVGETATEYLISWEDDEETGEPYDDTWEPRGNANRQAVDDWEKQKADKKRIKVQSGQPEGSGLSSVQSSSAPVFPKQPGIPTLKKGRPRKVIQSSSPPPQEIPRVNGDQDRVAQVEDDLLEIGESQETQSGDQPQIDIEEPGPASPLFVPAESPFTSESSNQASAAVHISDPPSSYLAGAYEALSSSQIAPTSVTPTKHTPEPSQYVPDPNDVSTTTDGTTAVSLLPITPAEQRRPTTAEFVHSRAKTIPDSQSRVYTSSSVPAATAAEPSSAAPVQQQTELHLERSCSPASGLAERVPSTTDQNSPQPKSGSGIPKGNNETAAVDIGTHSPLLEEQHLSQGREQTHSEEPEVEIAKGEEFESSISVENILSAHQGPDDNLPDRPGEVVSGSQTEQAILAVETSLSPVEQGGHSAEEDLNNTSRSHPYSPKASQSKALESQREGERKNEYHARSLSSDTSSTNSSKTQSASLSSSAQPPVHLSQVLDRSSNPNGLLAERPAIPHPLDSSTQSNRAGSQDTIANHTAQQDVPLVRTHNEPSLAEKGANSQSRSQEAAKTVSIEHIDLTATTQTQPPSNSRFSVTPPPRQVLPAAQYYPELRPPSSISWGSSFPFQTQVGTASNSVPIQVSRSDSAGAALPNSSFQTTRFHSQPGAYSRTQLSHFSIGSEQATSVPFAQSAPERTSSPIPLAPSQSIGVNIFGESAPTRQATLSSPARTPSVARSMDASQSTPKSGMSLADRIKAARDKVKHERASDRSDIPTSAPHDIISNGTETAQNPSATPTPIAPSREPIPAAETSLAIPSSLASPLLFARDVSRSPSAVPHIEPLLTITQEEQNNSGRYETLLPQSQEYGAIEEQQHGSLTATAPSVEGANGEAYPETANLHTVSIGLHGHQRDQYPATVYYYREAIQRFLSADVPDAELVVEAKHFVERMRCITMHPDLDNVETLTQFDVPPSQQANWDVNCSAKFRFLKELFGALREHGLHVVIIASPGRVVDMLETFLRGIQVTFNRLGGVPTSFAFSSNGSVTATLLDTDVETVDADAADLVIAMDNFVRHDSWPLRALRHKDGNWAPFISLVVPRTVEHVERCLSPDLSDRALSRALISGIYQFRTDAGKLEEGQLPPKETALALADYLTTSESIREWPLGALSKLHDIGSQTESEVEPIADSRRTPQPEYTGRKRSHEPDNIMEDTTDHGKRARIAPRSTNAEEGEVTHISDSVAQATQSTGTELEDNSIRLGATEKRLQGLLIEVQNQRDEQIQALADLQYRHEDQRNRLIEVTTERDNAILTAEQAVTRYTEQSNVVSTLRNRRSELEQQLKEAHENLLNHTVPERAELEALRLVAVQANAEKEKLVSRLASGQRDVDYVRNLYQESSSRAQELAILTTDLENQLAVAQNKATGVQAQLRQMGYDSFTKNLQNENKKLKTILASHEAGLRLKDEEITKHQARGRMGTRGTSVPRSPRVGSPMKLDARSAHGSRQASPAAGEVRGRNALLHLHPLRNG